MRDYPVNPLCLFMSIYHGCNASGHLYWHSTYLQSVWKFHYKQQSYICQTKYVCSNFVNTGLCIILTILLSSLAIHCGFNLNTLPWALHQLPGMQLLTVKFMKLTKFHNSHRWYIMDTTLTMFLPFVSLNRSLSMEFLVPNLTSRPSKVQHYTPSHLLRFRICLFDSCESHICFDHLSCAPA